MTPIYKNIGHLILMLILLGGSAFFSGSETAFFNLSRRQKRSLKESKHKLQNLVTKLLTRPGQLLNCLLFGNMIVNVLFFAIASTIAIRVRQQVNLSAAAITAFVAFAVLVLFGEILPKSLAYANSKVFSITAALPSFLLLHIFTPIGFVFKYLILEPTLRIILGPKRTPKVMTVGEFKFLTETIKKQGLITDDENKLLTEVVELGFLKVRNVMKPRVDMTACAVTDPPERALEIMREYNLIKIPVYVKTIDNIVGLVYLRQILLRPGTSLDKIVQKVYFVPEQKTVESLLEFFRKTGIDTAIVVDEFGGIAGSVRLEDIAEELFGQIELITGVEPIKQLGPFKYRLGGNIAIHDWADVLGIDLEEIRVSTIGGLVTVLLGKIPQIGDVTYLGNLKFTVDSVLKHRVETVILTLEPFKSHDQ